MRFQLLALAVPLFSLALAHPSSSLHDLFTHPDVLVLGELDPSILNLTAHNHRDVAPSKRAMNLGYILYNINVDSRNQGNFQNFFVSSQTLITQGVP
jgi:hypothetical protein